ncbi:MAG: PorV/PorQ family protein [Bacteroidota bacterium]
MRIRFIFFLSLLLPCYAWAQDPNVPSNLTSTNAPKYSNEFLRIGIGARAFGMGNAQVATAQDVTAGYWNPAGLANESRLLYPELSLMHASYFANVANYNYIGFSMPVDTAANRYFGISLIRIGVDDIPNTLQLIEPDGSINYGAVSSFSSTEMAALLSYAWQPQMIPGLSLGTNLKIVYHGAGRFGNAWGFGLDLGARYQAGNFMAGLMVTDATQTYNAWTYNTETFEEAFLQTGNDIYQSSLEITRPAARLGLAYDIPVGRRVSLLVAMDHDFLFDGNRPSALFSQSGVSWEPRVGMELSYRNYLDRRVAFLRMGAYNFQYERNIDGTQKFSTFPTAGVGIVVKNFTIDYALANIGNFSEVLYTHIVSLKFHIQ